MKTTFFARRALLILCVVLFLTPFAMRGARFSLQHMKNNVKDWLPSDFAETEDLEWFGRHFLGEQFVIITWPGCTEQDPRFQKLVEKLQHEVVPAEHAGGHATPSGADAAPPKQKPFEMLSEAERRKLDRIRARRLGDELGLYTVGQYYENWGERGERWLKGDRDLWYFITPDGDLYRWSGHNGLPAYVVRMFRRKVLGKRLADGQKIARFGRPATPDRPNEFYQDPHKLTPWLFKSITTGPGVLHELSKKDGALWPRGVAEEYAAEEAQAKALERLSGTLFGPDGKQTCIMLTLSEPAKRDLKRVIGRPVLWRPRGRLLELASVECGIPEEDLKLGGPPVDNVAIDEEGQITLVRLIGYCALVGIVISLVCFRSVKVTMMVFFVGGVAAIASLGIVWWTGGAVDAILMSMPSLVYVLGLSGAVHIVNYYRDAVEEGGLVGGPERALAHGWKPCTLAALTTALGLMSLNTSNLIPIKKFGFYSAIAVMATLLLLFSFLPSALQLWPPRLGARRRAGAQTAGAAQHRLRRFWEPVGGWIVRHYVLVTAVCVVVFVTGALGLPKIHTTVHLIKLFARDAEIIKDYAWLEEHLGKLVPMELVVRVRPEMMRTAGEGRETNEAVTTDQRLQLSFLERMEIAARIQRVLESTFGEKGQAVVGRGMSVPTFAPELPPPEYASWRNPVRWAMNGELEEHRHEYLDTDYLRIDRQTPYQGSELWRVSLRLGALMDIDYGQFVSELERATEPILTAYRFRRRILTELDRQRQGEGFVKARVAFLGVPDPASDRRDSASDAAVAGDAGGAQAPAEPDRAGAGHHVDQTRIFTETLRDLMICAGVEAGKRCWHDPDDAHADQGFYSSEKWGNVLSNVFDCVVLVRDHEDYDVDFIKRHAKLFIDARDHCYDPTARDAQTARQRDDLIHVVYTGAVPIVYKAQRTLLVSLVKSIGWAFVMISLVMMFLLRERRRGLRSLVNVRAGLLAMVPNVFPVVLIFGAMGHLRLLVDIGTMMTASVAMGVAVDDTIHFLTWFSDGIQRGLTRRDAIIEAYKRCAAAMSQTTLIGGLGLAVFAFSTFTPTQCFGVMMLTLLAAALVGDLIFLPAILAGPLGRYFCPPAPGAERAAEAPGETPNASRAEHANEGQEPSGGPPGDPGFASPHVSASAQPASDNAHCRKDQAHDRFKR